MTDEREPLSGPDNAWRRMGDRTNLMEITGVLVFEEPVGYDALRTQFEERLLPFRRFRQRIVGRDFGRRPRWTLDDHFDIENHLHHVALPEPQDERAFQRFVGGLMSQPIDRTKPLWQAYLVEGAGPGAGNAVVVRIHHSIADGFALLYVLLGLADDPGGIELPVGSVPSPPDHVEAAASEVVEEATGDDGGGSAVDAARSAVDAARLGASMATTAYRALTMDDDPETPLVGDLQVGKRAAWTDPLDVERLKAVGRAHDATINDVLLAATAGALRRHLEGRDVVVPPDLELRSAVPVNLKPLEERDDDLGNAFGLGFLPLPVGTVDVDERIDAITTNTGELRQGTEAFLMLLLLAVTGRGPPTLQRLVLRLFRDKATAVVTNVPGPVDSFDFAGREVGDIMFWVPQSNGIGLGISIFSYDGSVRVGVASDKGLLDEPLDLAEAFETEVEDLAAAVE